MAKGMFRVILFIIFSYSGYINCVEVCDDFKYYVKPNDEHCHNNPDGERNMTEILRNWPDVTVEEHYFYTVDGYKIFLLRAYSTKEKGPVLLGHGTLVTAYGWVNRGKKSLAHFLIQQGYDVWIISFRGGFYSREHKNLQVTDSSYWMFSLQEVALYDLGGALDYIVEETSEKILYIAHSGGTTLGFIYGSLKVKVALTTLKGMVSMAPLAYLDGMKSYLRFVLPAKEYLKPLINQRFHGEVPLDMGILNCSSLFDMYLSEVAKVPFFGDDFAEIDPSYLPLIRDENMPKTVGINVLVQYAQIMKSKKFQALDYGKDNMDKYGQDTPPEYPLSKIPVPVSLFVGSNDWVSTETNAKRIYSELNSTVQCGFNIIACEKWNHIDFIEAKNVVDLLYVSLFKAIAGLSEGTCLNQM